MAITNTELTMKQNLKSLRESKGLSKKKFAAQIGIDLSYYSRLEKPDRNVVPRFTTLEKICNYHNITVSQLFEKQM